MPDQVITEHELRNNNGDKGTRMWIAYNGIVYDVTDCPRWRSGLHELNHFPGQDLTTELPEAPHDEMVFRNPCVKIIGKLVSDIKQQRQ